MPAKPAQLVHMCIGIPAVNYILAAVLLYLRVPPYGTYNPSQTT